MIKLSDLDKRICDCVEGAENTETFREFIKSSEEYFYLAPYEPALKDEYELNNYINFLDYLWTK